MRPALAVLLAFAVVPAALAAAPVTYRSAATLPRAERYDGRSIDDVRLTRMVYRTLPRFARPRVLAVACWSAADWPRVAASADIATEGADSTTEGFWLAFQPHWLHLAPDVCRSLQQLLEGGFPTARRAFALKVALHEASHAYGVNEGGSFEARANCYAVQLVPYAARALGLSARRADYLRKLALTETRRAAPAGYWNAYRCRDGGAWDLLPRVANLR